MNEVFAVFDASGFLTGITTIVTGLICVLLPLVAYRFIIKILRDETGIGLASDDDPDFQKGQSMIDDAKERECKKIFGSNYRGY